MHSKHVTNSAIISALGFLMMSLYRGLQGPQEELPYREERFSTPNAYATWPSGEFQVSCHTCSVQISRGMSGEQSHLKLQGQQVTRKDGGCCPWCQVTTRAGNSTLVGAAEVEAERAVPEIVGSLCVTKKLEGQMWCLHHN